MITAQDSRQRPQGAAKAIVSCSLQSGDHCKGLTTEAARMRSKSNRQLFVTVKRSPQSTHDRSHKDAQQKQSSVVRYSQAITAKYSRQKPQGCAAKAIVSCSLQSSDHRKVLTTEAARMRSKSNRQLFVTVKRSPQSTHDRSHKDAQQKQSSVVRYSQAITAKYSQQKPQGCAAKAIVSCLLQSGDHRKVLTTEAARMRSKSNRQLFVTVKRSPQSTHDRSPRPAPPPPPPRAEAARVRSKGSRQLLVTVKRSPQSTHDRSCKYSQQKQSLVVRYSQTITAKDSRQKPQGFAAKIVNCSTGDHCKILTREAVMIHTQQNHSRSLFKAGFH